MNELAKMEEIKFQTNRKIDVYTDYNKLSFEDEMKINTINCKNCAFIGRTMYICHGCQDVMCKFCTQEFLGQCCKGKYLEIIQDSENPVTFEKLMDC